MNFFCIKLCDNKTQNINTKNITGTRQVLLLFYEANRCHIKQELANS